MTVVANLNQSRDIETRRMPAVLTGDYYTVSTSFQPKIIQFALDNYVPAFMNNPAISGRKIGPHYYTADIYAKLGL